MSIAVNAEIIGPPRGRTGRLRIDMDTLLSLHAQGYAPRQIAKVLQVSDSTVRVRLREHLREPKDERMAELGRKGQKAQKRSMARRRREAKAEAKRQQDAQARDEMIKLGLLALVADRIGPAPKTEE